MIIYDGKKRNRTGGSAMLEMIGKKAELGSYERFSITKVIVDPSYTDKKHFHKNSDELYYVMKGRCFLEIGDKHYLPEEGMCFLIEHGEQHFIKGMDQVAELIVVCSPAWDEKDCFYV